MTLTIDGHPSTIWRLLPFQRPTGLHAQQLRAQPESRPAVSPLAASAPPAPRWCPLACKHGLELRAACRTVNPFAAAPPPGSQSPPRTFRISVAHESEPL